MYVSDMMNNRDRTYLEKLRAFGWIGYGPLRWCCHMLADTVEELHAMADALEIPRAWFRDPVSRMTSFAHYDLTQDKRNEAIGNGAIEIDRQAFEEMTAGPGVAKEDFSAPAQESGFDQ